MELKEKIAQILEKYLENDRYFIVDIRLSISKIHSKVLILIDSDEGISIDECEQISRKLGTELDEIMPDKYTLEVSSPGVDFPLISMRMYKKNIGRNLKVILKDGNEIRGKFEDFSGEDFHNQQITIIEEKKRKKGEEVIPLTIPIENIKESKVIVSFK